MLNEISMYRFSVREEELAYCVARLEKLKN